MPKLSITKKTIIERDVKERVKQIIEFFAGKYDAHRWFFMPVPHGLGKSTVDFLFCFKGQLFAVETKIAGKRPTARQQAEIVNLTRSDAITLVVDELNLADLVVVLDGILRPVQDSTPAKPLAENIRRIETRIFATKSLARYFERAREGNYKV